VYAPISEKVLLKVPGKVLSQLFFSFVYVLLYMYCWKGHSPYASFSFPIRNI